MSRWLRTLAGFPLALPLAFEPAPAPGSFVAHLGGARAVVSCEGIALGGLHIAVAGASAGAVTASEPMPGRVSYLLGRDPAGWRRDLPLSGRVSCTGVRPGVDLVFYGRDGLLEFDLVAAPGADLGALELAIAGAEETSLEADGDLALHAGTARIALRRPHAHQRTASGEAGVDARFVMRSPGRIGFATGAHDATLPLVIDPVLELSTYAGGKRLDTARAVAIDADGTVVVVGRSESNDFPTTSGSFQPAYAGSNDDFDRGDAFVMRLAPGGASLIWATYLGGKDADTGEGVGLGPSGDVYLVGGTDSKDFPTRNAFQPERNKDTVDAFAARLDAAGNDLVWSTYLGGKEGDQANAVAVDAAGVATLVGLTFSKDFPVTPGVFQPQREGRVDAFVTRFAANGSLLWSTFLGGEELTAALAVTLAPDGGAVVAGETNSNQFPTTEAAFQPKYAKEVDAFVSKLAADATSLVWSTFLGGKTGSPFAFDGAAGVALDDDENIHLVGATLSRDFPVSTDGFDTLCGKNGSCTETDAFAVELSPDACILLYGTYLGEDDADSARAVAVDARGHAHLTGFTRSNKYPVTPDAFQSERKGAADAFLTELNGGGTGLIYSTFFGSGDDDAGNGIALGDALRRHIVGSSSGGNLPIVGSAFQPDYKGDTDGFVAVFAGAPDDVPALRASLVPTPNPGVVDGAVTTLLTVRNVGSAAAGGTSASVTLPANFAFGSATASQGSCSFAAPVLSCALGAIGAGGSATVSFVATPGTAGVLPVVAQLAASGADPIRAGACVLSDFHDLAVSSVKAPKSVKVPAGGATTAKVDVEILNLSSHVEPIADAAVLADLVTLTVTPTGKGCSAPVVALDPKSSQKLPLDLAPQKKLKVSFQVTIDCADSDYTCSGHVDHAAIDGLPDSNPSNDTISGIPIDAVAK